MKTILSYLLLIASFWLGAAPAKVQAQVGADQLGAVRTAIAAGSAHDLAPYLAPSVEVGFDGDKQTYNAAQAELVLRSFFAKNGNGTFELTHRGGSNDGITYAMGRYVGRNGSYQVFIKLLPKRSSPTIDTLDFTKE